MPAVSANAKILILKLITTYTPGPLKKPIAVSANAKILILKLITTYMALGSMQNGLCLLMQRY